MKNIRPLVFISLALLLGLAAAAYAASWLQKQGSEATLAVLVAKRDLPMGTRLQPDMLETVRWPKAAVIQDPLSAWEQVQDRVVQMTVLKGEPLMMSKLAPVGEKGGLSSVLSPGQRAITVKVNEIVGVAGFALPGNFVDVMVNTADEKDQPISKIVIERIQVLAVAQDVSSNEYKPRVVNAVTLQVSPQQAEQIDLARSVGTLSLVLRSQSDQHSVTTVGARKLDFLPTVASVSSPPPPRPKPAPRKAAAEPVPPAPAPEPVRFEMIRGLSVSQD